MKGLHIYLGYSPIKLELGLTILYCFGYSFLCHQSQYSVYDVDALLVFISITGCVLVLSSAICANSNRGCLYKYFRSIPNGYRIYRKMYITLVMTGIARGVFLTVLSYGMNRIPWIGTISADEQLVQNLFFSLSFVIGCSFVTSLRPVEPIMAFVYCMTCMIGFKLLERDMGNHIICYSIQTGILVVSGILFIGHHLRRVRKIWHQQIEDEDSYKANRYRKENSIV